MLQIRKDSEDTNNVAHTSAGPSSGNNVLTSKNEIAFHAPKTSHSSGRLMWCVQKSVFHSTGIQLAENNHYAAKEYGHCLAYL